jgi:osmoprotectant transport system substrate-binding protein
MVETTRRAGLRVWTLLAAAALVAAACSGGEESEPAAEEHAVRVGAFNFPESEMIAEIYAQALEARGIPVERLGAIGTREIVHPALELGFVDVVPEYAGTMLTFVTLGENEPTFDSHATVTELRETLGPRGMIVLDPANAQNQNAVVVRTSFAAEHDLYGVSDLAPLAGTLTFGGPAECPERPFCLIGLRETYGLDFERFVPLPSSAVVADSLELAEIDVGLMFTTDPAMIDGEFTALVDDRDLQPAENVVPVVRWESFVRWEPELGDALEGVSTRLDTADLGLLNLRAQQEEADIAELARLWLAS